MATSSPVALFNTDPNLQAQAALLQQRQALAQKLMESGMTPIDTSNRTVGGVGYHISPFEGMAKALQTYMGQKGVQDTTQQQAALAGQAYGALLNKYQPGSDPSYSDAQRQGAEQAGMDAGMGPPDPQKMAAALMGQQPAQGGPNPNNPNGIPAELIAGYTAGMVPKEVFEAQAARYKPTEQTVQALQGGFDPVQANRMAFTKANTDPKILGLRQAGFSDEQIHQQMAAEAQKGNTMEGRPGQSLFTFNGSGPPQLTAVSPDPSNNQQFTVGPGGAVSAQPVPGSVPAKSALAGGTAGATATATTNNTLHMVTLPDGSVVPARGSEIPPLATQPGAITNPGNMRPPGANTGFAQYPTPEAGLAAIDKNLQAYGAKGINTVSAIISRWAPPNENNTAAYIKDVSARLGVSPDQKLDMNSPLVRHALSTGIMLHEQGPAKVFGAPPVQLGQSTAAKVGDTNQMEGMQKRYTELQNANTQAQTTSSYLRSIKDLAPAAATGRFTDKLQYVNSLLSQVGNERATDATTANNLLDKYSNQIVARLGQGGLGTDSARAILQSAYPNAHMTKEAIQEAADNLIGAQEMTMAKARILSPHGNAKDPVAYQQKEQVFDQNADPRMWQYAAIKDPTQRRQFIQKILKNDPSFLQRAEQLHNIGAL